MKMANKYLKKCPIRILDIRETQIKRALRVYLTPVRRTIIIESTYMPGWRERGSLFSIGENMNLCSHHGRQLEVHQKYNNITTMSVSSITLGNPKSSKSTYHYSQKLSYSTSLDAYQKVNWQRKYGLYTQWNCMKS